MTGFLRPQNRWCKDGKGVNVPYSSSSLVLSLASISEVPGIVRQLQPPSHPWPSSEIPFYSCLCFPIPISPPSPCTFPQGSISPNSVPVLSLPTLDFSCADPSYGVFWLGDRCAGLLSAYGAKSSPAVHIIHRGVADQAMLLTEPFLPWAHNLGKGRDTTSRLRYHFGTGTDSALLSPAVLP